MSDEKSGFYRKKRSFASAFSAPSFTRRVLFKRAAPAMRNRGPRYAQGELKYKDVANSAAYVFDTTGSVTLLNGIATGDDNTDRDGRQVHNKSIQVVGHVRPVDGSTGAVLCRLMLVWDSQPNGAIATIANILTASTSCANLNLDNRERFTILKDWAYSNGGIDTTATQTYAMSPTTTAIKWFIPLGGKKTTYGNTGNTIASINTGALLLVSIGNVVPNAGSLFEGTTRLRFHDA